MCNDKSDMLTMYCHTRDPALRNALVEEYLYLAQVTARRFAGRGVELEDLTQVASIALVHALERFDCKKGLAFTTFAVPTIAGEVRNYLRDKSRLMRLPRRGVELLQRIARGRDAFFSENGREPSTLELAEALRVSLDDVLDVLEMQRSLHSISLDDTMAEDGAELSSFLGREEEAYGRVEAKDMVARLLAQLDGTSRFVLEERFLRDRNQRDVAQELGVSQMQVSRLERKALALLREKLA